MLNGRVKWAKPKRSFSNKGDTSAVSLYLKSVLICIFTVFDIFVDKFEKRITFIRSNVIHEQLLRVWRAWLESLREKLKYKLENLIRVDYYCPKHFESDPFGDESWGRDQNTDAYQVNPTKMHWTTIFLRLCSQIMPEELRVMPL